MTSDMPTAHVWRASAIMGAHTAPDEVTAATSRFVSNLPAGLVAVVTGEREERPEYERFKVVVHHDEGESVPLGAVVATVGYWQQADRVKCSVALPPAAGGRVQLLPRGGVTQQVWDAALKATSAQPRTASTLPGGPVVAR